MIRKSMLTALVALLLMAPLALAPRAEARSTYDLPKANRLDKNRLLHERRWLETPRERAAFPYLGSNFEVWAPATKRFNCIAWSIGITRQWVWPGKKVAHFDRLYGRFGYKRIRQLDYRVRPGYQKIVLYGKVKYYRGRRIIECTHGARQLADGTWTSKLGSLPLVRHLTPGALNGPSYGRPIAVYVKKVA